MALAVGRADVLAYRMAVHGLGREAAAPPDLAVLDLGVQDTNANSAVLAVNARLPEVMSEPAALLAEDGPFAVVWSFRGAPHLHRRADLPALATALWPGGDADAMARLGAERAPLRAAGIPGRAAFVAVAVAMRAVVTEPLPKGEVSAGVTARLPEAYSYWCRTCESHHVYGGIFQLVGVAAGVQRVPAGARSMLAPVPGRWPVPSASVGTEAVVRTYLRLHGPATRADVAGYLGTSPTAIRPVWPADVVEVRVDGRRAWLPEEQVDALRAAPPPPFVRLLPPSDPFLQGRDRALLVPERAHQKAVWRIIGNPGAVLVGGDVAGVWRAKAATRRLDVTVQAFGALSATARRAVEAEAARLAASRGLADVRVDYAGSPALYPGGGRRL